MLMFMNISKILESLLLLFNALAIINERRVLKKCKIIRWLART